MLGSKALWRSGFPYPRWEVTTSVSAGPGQVADNVEHLELELWRRRGGKKQKHGYGVVVHVSVIHHPPLPEDMQKNSREWGTAESHQPRGERLALQPCWLIYMWRHVKLISLSVWIIYNLSVSPPPKKKPLNELQNVQNAVDCVQFTLCSLKFVQYSN